MSDINQICTLHSGRRLSFAQYGDPKGKPLFYFHGWPSSHLGAQKYDALAKKLHVRVIAPDRPGYGVSDYQRNRKLLDWPDDVVELAHHLHIKKFSVMGVSGGGPYAAVCAFKIPDRIKRIGIVVGLSPIIGPHIFDGMMWMSKIGWMLFGRIPFTAKISAMIQYANAHWGPSWGIYSSLFGAKADKKLYRDPKLRQETKRIFKEAFRDGYKGPELDLRLYTSEWRFDVGAIKSNVFLWYGAEDQNVSLNMGRYYKSHLPKSKLTIYPKEGHMISITHAEEIFKTLIS